MIKKGLFPLIAFLAAVSIFLLPPAAFGESVTGKISVFPQTAAVSDLKGPEIVLTRPEVKRGVALKAREESVTVAGRSAQTPEYKTIRPSGHDGGDFVFVRKR